MKRPKTDFERFQIASRELSDFLFGDPTGTGESRRRARTTEIMTLFSRCGSQPDAPPTIYEQIRNVVGDDFKSVEHALNIMRFGNRPIRRNKNEFPREVLTNYLATTAYFLLLRWTNDRDFPFPSRPQLIEETRKKFASAQSRRTGEQEEAILRRMTDRTQEINWGRMIREVGLKPVLPARRGRPQSALK